MNRFLSKWDPKVKNYCPSCKCLNEDIRHITTCRDEGRSQIFNAMVDELQEWLEMNYTPVSLSHAICTYLKGHGSIEMTRLLPYGSKYHSYALVHDRLGWRSFLEGRISITLAHEMHTHLSVTTARIGAADWAKGLVNWLIRITHRQWSYRNHVVHHTVEGRTVEEHKLLIQEMTRLLEVDPSTLLPRFRFLYEDQDFEALGAGSATNRLYWVEAAKAAVAASALARRRKRKRRKEFFNKRREEEATDNPMPPSCEYEEPVVPSEPGLRHKKRRLK